jgi:TfoX/Sxy family transcriptional regulator of competence genes
LATRQSSVDFILEQLAGLGDVSARKMFGEYCLYCNGKTVALVCDDQLFVKPTAAGKAFIDDFEEGFPYPGAKPWLLISEDKWNDGDWLSKLIMISAAELPLPRPKRPKKPSGSKKR